MRLICVTADNCPIKGQVFQQCRTCPATCDNPGLICTQECRSGCGCPPGQFIDERSNRCVPANQCPSLWFPSMPSDRLIYFSTISQGYVQLKDRFIKDVVLVQQPVTISIYHVHENADQGVAVHQVKWLMNT